MLRLLGLRGLSQPFFDPPNRLNNFARIQGFKQAYGLSAEIYRKILVFGT